MNAGVFYLKFVPPWIELCGTMDHHVGYRVRSSPLGPLLEPTTYKFRNQKWAFQKLESWKTGMAQQTISLNTGTEFYSTYIYGQREVVIIIIKKTLGCVTIW